MADPIKKRVSLGKPLQLTDEQLDKLASVTTEEMTAALVEWQAHAPDEFDELPLAPQEDGEDTATKILVGVLLFGAATSFVWNAERGVYINTETNRIVPFSVIRDIVDEVNVAQLSRMTALSTQLQAGEITLAEWQIGMAQRIKILNVNASVLARGGWAQMSQSDWGWTGAQIKEEYKFLRNFAEEIASGKQVLDGRFLYRAGMYENAGRGIFEDMRRRIEETHNLMEEEARELGIADHCEDCLKYAALGYRPIGTLPRIGDSRCKTNCHCRFKFRRRGPNGWIVSE